MRFAKRAQRPAVAGRACARRRLPGRHGGDADADCSPGLAFQAAGRAKQVDCVLQAVGQTAGALRVGGRKYHYQVFGGTLRRVIGEAQGFCDGSGRFCQALIAHAMAIEKMKLAESIEIEA